MVPILTEDSSSYLTVKKWAVQFKLGWDDIDYGLRSGHPKRLTTDEQFDAV